MSVGIFGIDIYGPKIINTRQNDFPLDVRIDIAIFIENSDY